MKIIYLNTDKSNPRSIVEVEPPLKPRPLTKQHQAMREISYGFYKKAVKKREARIKAVQEYFPGWMPEFTVKNNVQKT